MTGALTRWLERVPYVTPRLAVALGVPALAMPLLRGPVAWALAGAWVAGWLALVLAEYRRAPGPGALAVDRELPVRLSIGVANPVTVRIRNSGDASAVVVGRETPPAGFGGQRRFGPLEVPAHGEAEVTLRFTPPSRGAYAFGDIGLRSMGPLGLAGRQFRVALAEEARVYPDITAVRRYALLARKGALHELGVKAARYAGVGTEFESLRDYQPGDDYRSIDWKATARRAHPVVRSYETERSQTMVIAIDAGRLMVPLVGELSKLDRAVNAALLLAYLGIESGDLVGLVVFGRDVVTYVPPRKGRRQFQAVLEALYAVEGRVEEPDYRRALSFLSAKLSRRSLVVLFTDLAGVEPSRRLLGTLAGMMPRHLPFVVTQRNRAIEERGRRPVVTESDAFEVAVANDLLGEKAEALSTLAARGALVLDVEPAELSIAAVNRYLEVKARGRL
ncbi:MAG: DUF58 domain-containing protein [Coriobacteriia bacterium]